MTKPIEGKVARVLNAREIAINVGAADGVAVDMLFDVIDSRYSDITDPDTNEVLGSIVRSKVRVKIIHVEVKLSLATTYRTKRVNTSGIRLPDFSMFAGGGWVTKHETLKKTGKVDNTPDDLDESESYVKTGDPVVQVIKANNIEGEVTAENKKALNPAKVMSAYKKIKLNNLQEIEDRAIEGLTIPKEKLSSIASPYIERLYDANYENMHVRDSRDNNERMRDHQEYEYALVVTEIEQEPVRYAIYKGNREQCGNEFNRFEESRSNPEGYRQNGNGTKRKNIR